MLSTSNPGGALPPTPYVGSCFVADDGILDPQMRCLDPIPLLINLHQEMYDRHSIYTNGQQRCSRSNKCGQNFVCVRPRIGEHLLRIQFREYDDDAKVLLWNGPGREVWEQG